jgi:hypothetical protein
MKIESNVVTVTPQQARAWLEKNTRNRKLRERTVDSYATDIRNGDWQASNQGIAFDETGNLIDGQHRLTAIIAANTPVELLVVTGLPAAAQDVVDRGAMRSVGDQLAIAHGTESGGTVAAVCVMLAEFGTVQSRRMSLAQTRKVLELYRPEIEEVIRFRNTSIRGLSGVPILASLAFAMKAYPDAIRDFARRYDSGADLAEGNPILTLRNLVLRGVVQGQHKPGGGPRTRLANYAMLALMAHVNQQQAFKLTHSPKGLAFFKRASVEHVKAIRAVFHIGNGEQTA